MQTAKEQVAIKEVLLRARYNFWMAHQEMPRRLYLGQVDFANLRRECEGYELAPHPRPAYMGAWIYLVDEDHHIYYATTSDRTAGEP